MTNQEMDGELSSIASSSQMIEHFERTAEEQDAQDRVDQLLLEDELSDARITEQGSKEEPVSIGELLDQNSTTSVQHSVSIGSSEAAIITKTGSQLISVSVSQRLVENCQDLLCGCCELIHMRCAKVLNVRAKVCIWCVYACACMHVCVYVCKCVCVPDLKYRHEFSQTGKMSKLASADFMLIVRLIEKFVSDSASITGREHPNLRAPLLSQVNKSLLIDAQLVCTYNI